MFRIIFAISLLLCCSAKVLKICQLIDKNAKGLPTHLGSLRVALDDVEREINRTFTFQIVHKLYDSTSLDAVRKMKICNEEGVVAFIGSLGVNWGPEAVYAGVLNLPIINSDFQYKMQKEDALNRPTLVNMRPSLIKLSSSIFAIAKSFGWRSFSIVVDKGDDFSTVVEEIRTLSRFMEVSINEVIYISGIYSTESKNYTFEKSKQLHKRYKDVVKSSSEKTRIWVVFGSSNIKRFLTALDESGLNSDGGYAVIGVDKEPYDPNSYRIKKQARHIYKSVVLLLHRHPLYTKEVDRFILKSQNISSGEPYSVRTFKSENIALMRATFKVDGYQLYDGAKLLGRGLVRQEEITNSTNGTAIIKRLTGSTFTSIQGYEMSIDELGEVMPNYTVLAFTKKNKNVLQQAGSFYYKRGNVSDVEFSIENQIVWAGGRVPISDPKCGFKGEKCQFETNWLLLSSLLGVSLLLLVGLIFAIRHYRYEQALGKLMWKIHQKDLIFLDSNGTPISKDSRKQSKMSYTNDDCLLDATEEEEESVEDFTKLLNDTNQNIKGDSKKFFCKVASYRSHIVAIKEIYAYKDLEITRNFKKRMHELKHLQDDNLNRFIGVCLDIPRKVLLVSAYSQRGSLRNVLDDSDINFDDLFKCNLVSDLIKGMIYLHDSEIGAHGNLKSTNCLIDSRWILRITDFSLDSFKSSHQPRTSSASRDYSFLDQLSEEDAVKLFWTPPEVLSCPTLRNSQKVDSYAFGIILHEIHSKLWPFESYNLHSQEIIRQIMENNLKPDLTFYDDKPLPNCVKLCMEDCWSDISYERPDFKTIYNKLKPLRKGLKSNFYDNMISLMENHANNLENIVACRTRELTEEKKRSEALLLRMLPRSVAEQLKRTNEVLPEQYSCVTIFFSDIVGFTRMASRHTPMEIVHILNDLYSSFDSVIGEFDVYKVETIGDAYMVVSGLPERNGDNHAAEIASMALKLLQAFNSCSLHERKNWDEILQLRIGIHSGPAAAGVVGHRMPRYCLFGDTVNVASRMESNGLPMKIHMSEDCSTLLDKLGGYEITKRGPISIKGKGEMTTYFLEGEMEWRKKMKSKRNVRRLSSTSVLNNIPDKQLLAPSPGSNKRKRPQSCRRFLSDSEERRKLENIDLNSKFDLKKNNDTMVTNGVNGDYDNFIDVKPITTSTSFSNPLSSNENEKYPV
ncbi:DgyrCDS12754 [Dimorphilus gyrociliatus]|uniref:Guanylate cyclase n=1 Tax=Dimorphilus gyrociliatus TaxID=2664684 RepID=A0A7I8W7E3_9ANNE|nr:DgyrCDS12754 [Dimorphilus gyrociliatus]